MSVRSSSVISKQPALVDSLPQYKALSTIISSSFTGKGQIPQLTEMMKEHTNVHKVAEIFSEFITAVSTERVLMTQMGAQLIDQAVRYLISTSLRETNNLNMYTKNKSNMLTALALQNQVKNSDLEDLRVKLIEALTYIEDVQTQNRENQKDQARLAQEIETLFRDGTRLKERFLENKRVYEDQLSSAQAANQVLEDRWRDAADAYNLSQTKIGMMNKQILQLNFEVDNLNQEVKELKTKLANQKKLMRKSKTALEQSKHQIEEGKIRIQDLKNEIKVLKFDTAAKMINPEDLKNASQAEIVAAENYKLQQDNKELKDQISRYEIQINKMMQDNDSLSAEIDQRASQESKDLSKKLQTAQDKNNTLQQTINDLNEKYNTTQDEQQKLHDRIQETEKQLKETKETLDNYQNVLSENKITLDDIPKIMKLPAENTQQNAVIQQLRSSLDALCRFTKKLIEDDTADPKILDQNSPLFQDDELREQIVSQIEDMREYVLTVSQDDLDTVILYDAIFGYGSNIQALIDSTILKRENNIYSGLIILVSILNKSQKYISKINSDLESVYKIIPGKGNSRSPSEVADYFGTIQEPLKRIRTLLKKEFGKMESSPRAGELLNSFIEVVDDLIHDLNNKVKPVINYRKSILQLPDAINEEVERLRQTMEQRTQEFENELRDTEDKYEERLTKLEGELQKNRNREDITARFQEIIQRKDEEIRKTKQELSEIQDKHLQAESENSSLQTRAIETELNHKVVSNQRNRLQKLLDQRKEHYEQLINELTETSKKERDAEVARLTKKFDVEKSSINMKIEEKSKKIKDLQSKINDQKDSFEAIIRHQRSEMKALVDQNARLTKKINKLKAMIKNNENSLINTTLDPTLLDNNPQSPNTLHNVSAKITF